ncbi:hypothetical protein EDEG_03092 [Edhazardia aedis USNM 41457]|uniref:Zinc-ribbon 15 domain-containing protein n=1 Tax=Edhazardia aedis (strain USNM 41457) TaxID=1003232 RepID=J9D3W3_EDHAE|nr:hypothetical protein EDEG_03092 [Edhazardia aedis USNM 41457]|eukprot:EJW02506.1 hypothetical protein EDEG_03092 [Edhazardia aedis USNM 41457]
MICPVIIGCNNKTNKLNSTPRDYPEPPEQVLCDKCGNRINAVYRRNDYYFSICFLNLFRISKGTPYLSCNYCEASFGGHGTNICEDCRTAVPSQFKYCPHCGNKSI